MKPAAKKTVSLLQGFDGGVPLTEGKEKAFFRFPIPDGPNVAGPGIKKVEGPAFAECGIGFLIPHEVSVSVNRTNSAGPCLPVYRAAGAAAAGRGMFPPFRTLPGFPVHLLTDTYMMYL